MAARKTERLVNLTILLLSSRRFLPRESIRESLEAYRDLTDQSFERTFERDKDELRALGIPIEVGSDEHLFDDDMGYRISRSDFELPSVEFTTEEATVIGLASQVWQQASIAEPAAQALGKLRAVGVDLDPSRLSMLAPQLSVREEAFDSLWDAMVGRQEVRFCYRKAEHHSEGEQRTVQPWRLVVRNNNSYLLGFDRNRQAPRMFKLSRIVGAISTVGKRGAFAPPASDELADHVRRLIPAADMRVELAIQAGRAPALRRRGEPIETTVALPSGFDSYRIDLSSSTAVGDVASYGSDVIVLAPAEFREAVMRHLSAVIDAHQSTVRAGADES